MGNKGIRITEGMAKALALMVGTMFLFAGCASMPIESFYTGKQTFSYTIPSPMKLEGVKTVAVLSSKTDASQTLQAQLMEGFQKLNVNIIDTQQLANIALEKKLKASSENLRQFGKLTNVDLFLVAEVIGPDKTAFKAIDKEGRIALARFVSGRTDAERVNSILKIFTDEKRLFDYDTGYQLPVGDKDKKRDQNKVTFANEIFALHKEGKYQEVEKRLKQALTSSNPPLTKLEEALYHVFLSDLYVTQKRFSEAMEELNKAEAINSGLDIFSGKIPAEELHKVKVKLKSIIQADTDAKASSASLAGYKNGAPNIAVLEFDTAAIQDKPAGWLTAATISTYLAQSNFNVYDRDYFRSLIQTQSNFSEKERAELLGVDKLIYGKFLKKTQVVKTSVMKPKYVAVYEGNKYVGTRQEGEELDKMLVRYELEIQGRVTDVKTSFGKFQTVKKEPATVDYPGGQGIPGSDRAVEAEWEEKLYDQLSAWEEKTLAN